MSTTAPCIETPTMIYHPARTGKCSHDPAYCHLLQYVTLTEGTMDDYRQLSRYHYRDTRLGPVAAIWTLRQSVPRNRIDPDVIGVIVYTYPAPNVAARHAAIRDLPCGQSTTATLRWLNQHLRCISRVIIEPRWRRLGLAAWLVKKTMPRMNVPIIESMAAMGRFNPFLERAGMRRIEPPENPKAEDLKLVLDVLGIDPAIWHDPRTVQAKIDALPLGHQAWMDLQMRRFLGAFGCRRNMPAGIERTAFVLEKLSTRWSYFIWQNRKLKSQ